MRVFRLGEEPREDWFFDPANRDRVTRAVRGREIPFIGRDALLQNKRATGRTKDLADAELLEG